MPSSTPRTVVIDVVATRRRALDAAIRRVITMAEPQGPSFRSVPIRGLARPYWG